MNFLALTFLAASLGAPGAKESKDAPLGLVGTWTLESSTLNGNPLPLTAKLTVTYSADGKYETRHDGKVVSTGTYTIDPKKDPAELDTKEDPSGVAVPPPATAWPAIYKIDGDTLTVAVRADSKRPDSFKAVSGSGLIVSVMKRQKQ